MTKKKNNLETSADEAPIKAENPSSKKPRSEIDEIFDGKKRKKSEQEKTQKPIKGDAAVKPKGMKKTKEKKKKKKTEKGNLGNDESFGVSDSRPRKKTEGFSIYTEEELGLNNPDAGDNRDRPGLSREQPARIYKINDLPIEEFNWKVLGTSNNMVACGLLPKGAAFPDPPVLSSKPSSSKKKPRKMTDLGASSSRIRKRKALATLPTSEPSSPETASPPAPQPAPQEEEMVIGSGLRAPPSTLGSMAKTKTPESTPSSKGKGKVDSSKKRKVVFEDFPASSPPLQPQPTSHPEPPKEAATSSEPILSDKDEEFFALLNQLPEKAGMSAAFIDRFTSEEGWERMKRRSAKVAFGSAMRMLANTAAAAVLMHDPVLECLEKAEKVEEITQAFENSEKAREEERTAFNLERQQMLEDLAKERLEKENLEEKVKELEKIISEHPDHMREATTEAVHKAIEEFKATEVKELEDKASDIASSTIIFNIFCEHPDFIFSILGEDVVELVQSWREDTAKAGDGGASPSA